MCLTWYIEPVHTAMSALCVVGTEPSLLKFYSSIMSICLCLGHNSTAGRTFRLSIEKTAISKLGQFLSLYVTSFHSALSHFLHTWYFHFLISCLHLPVV